MKHKVYILWSWAVYTLLYFWPNVPAVMRLRGRLYGLAMASCGKRFEVANDVRILGLETITVGDDVYFAPGVVVLAGRAIEVESEVMLAHKVLVTDGNHSKIGESYRFGPRNSEPVSIGYGTWVGAHGVILAGVSIGRGALVAAGAVVSSNVPDFSTVGGVPARILGGVDRGRPA